MITKVKVDEPMFGLCDNQYYADTEVNEHNQYVYEPLKPCPFCGSEPEVWEEYDVMWRSNLLFIRCSNKNCIAHSLRAKYTDEQFLVDYWNVRGRDQWIYGSGGV